ncbi:peptidylprolyl isomerase [Eionea flava]
MKHFKIMMIIIGLALAGCSDDNKMGNEKEKFEAFLKLKRIPLNDEARYQRMQQEYQQRSALTNAIEKTDELDALQIAAEVEEFRKQLLISRYFESYLNNAVTEQGIQNFYSKNIDQYKSRKVQVAHILFRVNPRMGEVERQALLTTALDAYGKLNTGIDFSELAKEVSQDKVSAVKGGDLGWINEGAVAEEFSEKAFSMKAGDISEPFLTSFGFHIIKVLEEPQDVVKPLESLKGDIRYQMRNQAKEAEIQRLLESVNYKQEK